LAGKNVESAFWHLAVALTSSQRAKLISSIHFLTPVYNKLIFYMYD